MQNKFEDFLSRYVAAWDSPAFAAVLDLWDPTETEPWHFPEELDHGLIGRDAIAGYLAASTEAINSFSVKITDSAIKPLADNLFTFRFSMRWRAVMQGNALFSKPIGAEVRVSGVLRDTADGLKLVHYMEAGPAALPYLIAQYERFAQ